MARTEYVNDPDAPAPNALVVAASAVVTNDQGQILLHRRSDNAQWSVPGGAMELGESIAQTVVREVKEETGFYVEVDRLVGIYSDPRYVVAYSDGEVRQQFSICFACHVVGGAPSGDDESMDVAFFESDMVLTLPMGDAIRRRIRDFLADHEEPVIA